MGSGSWTRASFEGYTGIKGMSVNNAGSISGDYHAQDMFKQRRIAPELDPRNVMRECCDSEEHPNTIPVILGLDVTGSMGGGAVEVAKNLNVVMTSLYEKIADVEFMIMGIGDLAYDDAPIQASQFESDIRIAEQLDKIYFEGGGGGNSFESYTAAWYFGLRHTKLDCWNRSKKGIIITMGDEPLNPYLPKKPLSRVTGDNLQGDVETKDLYEEASRKFDIYHLAVNDSQTSYRYHESGIKETFGKYLDGNHLCTASMDNIANAIVDIVTHAGTGAENTKIKGNAGGMISW